MSTENFSSPTVQCDPRDSARVFSENEAFRIPKLSKQTRLSQESAKLQLSTWQNSTANNRIVNGINTPAGEAPYYKKYEKEC